jgi:PAS domain S-box-containing protein
MQGAVFIMEQPSSVVQLASLFEAIDNISKSKDLEDMSNELFDFIEKVIEFNMAILYVINYEKKQLEVLSARGSCLNNLKKRVKFRIGEGAVGWVAKEKKAIVLKNAMCSQQIRVRQHSNEDPVIRSYMAVPLIVSNHVIGILSISNSKPDMFRQKDVQMISIIGSQVAAILEANRTLNETRQFSNHILENVNSGIIVIDNIQRVITFNKQAENITGYSRDEVIGKDIKSIPLKESPWSWFVLDTLLVDKQYSDVESYIITKNGDKKPVSISTSLLRDDKKRKNGATCVFRDISGIKMLQEKVRRVDRLAMMGQCTAALAHEIRNPLLPIRTAASILLRKEYLEEEEKNLIKIVFKEAERLNTSLNNFMKLAKSSTEKPIRTNVLDIVNETYQLLKYRCQSKDISVKVFCDRKDYYIYIPPSSLKEIFLNLYINSIDAMEEGGKIKITLRKNEEKIIIDFRDTGCGIPEENLYKIFDPFFTTKDQGTGLGLSVVHNIVNNVGGDINVYNCIDGGTRFQISLPCAK